MLCRYAIKRNAQGYWQILFSICTQISYAALLEISRKMNFTITATCHNSYTVYNIYDCASSFNGSSIQTDKSFLSEISDNRTYKGRCCTGTNFVPFTS